MMFGKCHKSFVYSHSKRVIAFNKLKYRFSESSLLLRANKRASMWLDVSVIHELSFFSSLTVKCLILFRTVINSGKISVWPNVHRIAPKIFKSLRCFSLIFQVKVENPCASSIDQKSHQFKFVAVPSRLNFVFVKRHRQFRQ